MKGEKIKKNEWEKDFKKKNNIESCANFKEEINILLQMNVLPSPSLRYKTIIIPI